MPPSSPDALADLAERGVPAGLPTVAEVIERGLVCLIAYARISDTRAGKRDETGVTTQHASIRARVRRLGPEYLIVHRYTDNDLSSAKDEYRPDFEAMLADLRRGTTSAGYPVHGVVCVDEDRIYRLPAQWQYFVSAFRSHPGRHFSDHAGYQDLYAEGAEIRGLVNVAISMGEIRKKKARARLWHEGRAMRGIPHTGGRPFGYSADGMTLDPAEAPIVRAGIEACIAGKSWASIVRIFADSGIPTRKGGIWRGQTVKQIVCNPRNAGLRMIDGEIYLDEETGEPKIGAWETICTVDELFQVWRRARPRVRKASRDVLPLSAGPESAPKVPRGDRASKYLLSGILRCGKVNPDTGRQCGAGLRATPDTKGKAGHMYVCPPKTEGGCSGIGRSGKDLDARIEALVKAKLRERASRAKPAKPWDKEEMLTELDRKLNALNEQWLAGEISDARYFTLSGKIEDHLKSLRRERAAWLDEQATAERNAGDVDLLWANMDLRQRRATIREMFAALIVHPVGRGRKNGKGDALEVIWSED